MKIKMRAILLGFILLLALTVFLPGFFYTTLGVLGCVAFIGLIILFIAEIDDGEEMTLKEFIYGKEKEN